MEDRTQIINYIKENIEKEKYQNIPSIEGVKDIVVKKGLTFDNMTYRQQQYVRGIYSAMQGIENKNKKNKEKEEESNRRYNLSEKPEVIMKIQRLQSEVSHKTPQYIKEIVETVMKTRVISEKQLKYINKAYITIVIEGKEMHDKSVEQPTQVKNKKYTLEERVDIKNKIDKIMESELYYTLTDIEYSIVSSVSKYKTFTEKQLMYIERAYEKIGGV